MSVKIPLHLPLKPIPEDAMTRLSLLADMATLNPKGFRAASEKKNRTRIKTRAEKLMEIYNDRSQ
jgi:hypothetical protein